MRDRDIFIEALEMQTPAERAAFLDEACRGEGVLRQQVAQLLAEHERRERFILDTPPPGVDATRIEAPAEQPGQVVGPYTLVEQIGEGGFSVVFRAEQRDPVRTSVALKIIKPGMDSRQVIARFTAERHTLALMDHPNIAKVLNAGCTESGRPYFVMELVSGTRITEYCDARRLTIDERLRLLATVCQAVQHAHHKGIIHRDIKPSNVLVAEYDGKPVPKIIDFGVAKATDRMLIGQSVLTEHGQVIGTLEYMSPEQAAGNADIDTRSDVYSLGVLLYELVAGSPPFDSRQLRSQAYAEMHRILREDDPPPPSATLSRSPALPTVAANRRTEPQTLSHRVRGELDWIVMKALEKERARRYESAGALAADLARYLNDEPVVAAAPSRVYRLGKFVRRNRWPVIAAAALLAGAIAGVVGLSIGLANQSRARAIAERERTLAELNLATALHSLGNFEKAEELYRQALGDEAAPLDPQRSASTRLRLAQVVHRRQGPSAAEPLYRQAIAEYRAAFAPNDPNIAFALNQLGALYRDGDKHADAERLFREALAIHQQATPVNHYELAKSLLTVGDVLCWQQKYDEAEPYYRQSVAEHELALPPGDTGIALVRMEMGFVLIRLRRFTEAEALMLASEPVLRASPPWRLHCTAGLVGLYATWDQAEPGKGHDEQMRDWSLRILDGYVNRGAPAVGPEPTESKPQDH